MGKYYAYITGGANIEVPVNPGQLYTNNSNHLTLEFNGDNLRTDTVRNNAAVWIRSSGNWFSFEMYGQGWEYLNLGSTVYIGRYNYWSTSGFDSTFVVDIDNGNVTLTKGQQTSATTFSGGITASNMFFFKSDSGRNCHLNYYRLGIYGYSGGQKTLLYDFVPDLSGSTKGLRDKVSGNFYAATDQSKIELIALSTFETDVTAITATYSATTTSVTLTADEGMDWTASTVDNWITVSPASGTGSATITISVLQNKTYISRTGSVEITNGEDTIEIECTQEKYPLFVPSENIYRADLEVVKAYRSGSTINKAYRSGELIYLRLNPPTE